MSESIVSQKFTKIHMIKMLKCVTGLGLKECIDKFDEHMKIEHAQSTLNTYLTDDTIEKREQMQHDLLCKMMNKSISRQLEKEINKLEDELNRLRAMSWTACASSADD